MNVHIEYKFPYPDNIEFRFYINGRVPHHSYISIYREDMALLNCIESRKDLELWDLFNDSQEFKDLLRELADILFKKRGV